MAELELLVGERLSGESNKAVIACNDFLRLGPGRSLVALEQKYTEFYRGTPPTESKDTLKQWSSRFGWADRATVYDAEWEERKNAERRAVMQAGLALDYERIKELEQLGAFLLAQVYEQGVDGDYHNVWLPDVKQIGSGEYAERVDIERFNASLFAQLRGVLDDIAAETGGRVRLTDITSMGEKLAGPTIYLPAVEEDGE